jgi:outer membrane protein assembly factor BamB
MRFAIVLTIGLFLNFGHSFVSVQADDWPQWMGPERDAVWREKDILAAFPKDGPKVLWRVPVGLGYSGPAVVGEKVFLTDYVKAEGDVNFDPGSRAVLAGEERVLCLDRKTGKQLWVHKYNCPYSISYSSGPRTTPTVDGNAVYTLGAEGNLICLNANTGKVIWEHDLKSRYQVETPIWGFCGHPLVDGKKLICLVGGEGSVAVAFDKDTGEELWRAVTASQPGYCPPSIIEAGGTRQLLIWDADKLNSLNPEDGTVYWSIELKPAYDMSIMAPRKSGNFLFASGIGNVSVLLELDQTKPDAKEVWRGQKDSSVYCANSTPFIEDGVIYGCCCDKGQLRGVDLKTGKRLWETFKATTGERRGGHGTAFLVKNENRFFLMSETGDLVIAQLLRTGYKELSRTNLLEPTGNCFGRDVVWSHPAFAGKCCFARNDKELVCVSLAK